jgi:hypothetical protein
MKKECSILSILTLAVLILGALSDCQPDPNHPPQVPTTPNGQGSGGARIEHFFWTSSWDSDGDSIAFQFDWGDSTMLVWGIFAYWGDYNIGHSWLFPGSYEIRARAKDIHGAVTDWSSPALIVISQKD